MLADRNQLEVALINLVINARDAIDGAGTRDDRVRQPHVVGHRDRAADRRNRSAPATMSALA